MPTSPNTSVKKELQNNIDQFNELCGHLEGVRMYYSVVFLLQTVVSVLVIAFNCFIFVDRLKNYLFLEVLHSTAMALTSVLEMFLLCRLMEYLNDSVSKKGFKDESDVTINACNYNISLCQEHKSESMQ